MNDFDTAHDTTATNMPATPRRNIGPWLIWVAGILLGGSLLFNLVALLAVVAVAGEAPIEQGPFVDKEIEEGQGEKVILVIELDGPITTQGEQGMFGDRPSIVAQIEQRLAHAATDARVGAVVLGLNTPGGGVTASDRIHHAISAFRKQTGIPVIAHMGAICASGGYYSAVACDEISASPTTVTGSIGVIMSLMNAEVLFTEKLGLVATPITSGEHKDMGSPFRALRDEERALFQEIVDTMYHRFVDLVVANRSAAPAFSEVDAATVRSRVVALADGRILHADQALAGGLVDELIYRDALYDRLRSKPGLADAAVIRYEVRPSGLSAIFGAETTVPVPADAATTVDAALTPRFSYRWAPGLLP